MATDKSGVPPRIDHTSVEKNISQLRDRSESLADDVVIDTLTILYNELRALRADFEQLKAQVGLDLTPARRHDANSEPQHNGICTRCGTNHRDPQDHPFTRIKGGGY